MLTTEILQCELEGAAASLVGWVRLWFGASHHPYLNCCLLNFFY